MRGRSLENGGIPELIPERDLRALRALKPYGKIVDGRPAMADIVCKELRDTLGQRASMAVFLDGAPGTGKSGLGDKIKAKAVQEGLLQEGNIFTLDVDLFLGTERDTPERAGLTATSMSFWRKYIRYEEAKRVLGEAIDIVGSEEGGEIEIPKAYVRNNGGKFTRHTLTLRPHTRLLIVDGVGSVGNLLKPELLPPWLRPYSVMMHASVKEGLFHATLRDMLNGRDGTNFEQLYQRRLEEYRYIIPELSRSIPLANKICSRFPKSKDFADSVRKKDNDIKTGQIETRLTMQQVLASIEPDFLRSIFPGEIPKEVLSGKNK